jgi:tetratricopeptide (TPR) repeat protein
VLAYSGLADSYGNLGFAGVVPPNEMRQKGKQAALKAVELDEKLAEAHTSLAAMKEWCDWDFVGAEREYRRALELNPEYPSAHQRYGVFLEKLGRFDAAIAELKRAQQLDPLSLIINSDLGFAYYSRANMIRPLSSCVRRSRWIQLSTGRTFIWRSVMLPRVFTRKVLPRR